MKQLVIIISVFICSTWLNTTTAQSNPEYKAVDDYVKSVGPLDSLNMGSISNLITKNFPQPKDKVRAIFDWIAYNISYDLKSSRTGATDKNTWDIILKTRKATAAGYASLFQDMCSVAKIRCLTVDGYAKITVEQINEKPDEFNHTWVVVQLGQSPDTWQYVDPTLGSGYTDDKMSVYTKDYNDAYFFADKAIFNMDHFPDNKAWNLGPTAKDLSAFLGLPLIKRAAYEYGIKNPVPNNGFIKAKVKKAVLFSFSVKPDSKIDIVALAIGPEKRRKIKTVDYNVGAGIVNFNFTFEEADEYPVTVMINNKPVLGYFAEISE